MGVEDLPEDMRGHGARSPPDGAVGTDRLCEKVDGPLVGTRHPPADHCNRRHTHKHNTILTS